MKIFLLRFFILFAYYILGAFATTDIPRLMKGSTTPINAKDCYCPVCGYRIPLPSQLPVFSYIKNKADAAAVEPAFHFMISCLKF